MDGKARFNKCIEALFILEDNLINKDKLLRLALEEIFYYYEHLNKTMEKLFKTRYAWDVNAELLILQNMFLEDDRIEKKLKLKDKEKYKSIYNEEDDFEGMICRATALFGSLLDCVKTTKTKQGTYEHKIKCYEWEDEY